MGIACEVFEDLRWSSKGRLGVYHPVSCLECCDETLPVLCVSQRLNLPMKGELPGVVSHSEVCDELLAEKATQHSHWDEEVLSARDPLIAIKGDSPTWDDAVDVWMMVQILTPCVKHCKEADLSTEVLRVSCYSEKSLRNSTEEKPIDEPLVLKGQGTEFVRKRKHHVEIRHTKELPLPCVKPLGPGSCLTLGAVAIATGVVGDLLVTTKVTYLLVAAQSSGTTD